MTKYLAKFEKHYDRYHDNHAKENMLHWKFDIYAGYNE